MSVVLMQDYISLIGFWNGLCVLGYWIAQRWPLCETLHNCIQILFEKRKRRDTAKRSLHLNFSAAGLDDPNQESGSPFNAARGCFGHFFFDAGTMLLTRQALAEPFYVQTQ